MADTISSSAPLLTPRQESEQRRTSIARFFSNAPKSPVYTHVRDILVGTGLIASAAGVAALSANLAHDIPVSDAFSYYLGLAEASGFGQFLDVIQIQEMSHISEAAWNYVHAPSIDTFMDMNPFAFNGEAFGNSLDNVATNIKLVGVLWGIKKSVSLTFDYLHSKDGVVGAQMANGSPINVYHDHLKKHDTERQFDLPSQRMVNFSGARDQVVQKGLSLLRRSPVGKLFTGSKRDGYTQGELNCLNSLAFLELMKDEHPDIGGIRSHRVFDHPAFNAIFKNANVLSKALLPNIENYAKFSKSVYRSLSGLEEKIFDLAPSLDDKEKNEQIIQQFEDISIDALKHAHREADQRKMMAHSIGAVSAQFDALLNQYPNGKVDEFQIEHLHNFINITKNALMDYDTGHGRTVYANLYDQYEVMQSSMQRVLDRHANGESNGKIDINKVRGLSLWCGACHKPPEQAVSDIWEKLMPDVSQTISIDGMASSKLLEGIKAMALSRSGGITQEADDVTVELGKRATFDVFRRR